MALPALADDLDAAVASARGGSLPIQAESEAAATASSRAQAAAQKPFHADLSGLLGVCEAVGEVVGKGPDIAKIFEGFRNSGAHWSIITGSEWTAMGSGQTRGDDGYLYVSVVFCRATTSPAPPPSTTPTTAPAPEPTTSTTAAPPTSTATPVPAPQAFLDEEPRDLLLAFETDDRALCLAEEESPDAPRQEFLEVDLLNSPVSDLTVDEVCVT